MYLDADQRGRTAFGAPILVTNDGYVGGIAIDSKKQVHVIWSSPGNTDGGYYRRFDANDNIIVGTALTTFPDAEPEVAVDTKDRAHVVYMAGSSVQNNINIAASR